MKSHQRLYKLVIESKIGDTKDLMQYVSIEINNNRCFCYYLWKDARDLFSHSYQIPTLANGWFKGFIHNSQITSIYATRLFVFVLICHVEISQTVMLHIELLLSLENSRWRSKLATKSQKDYFRKRIQLFFPKNNFYMQMNFWIHFFVTCSKKYKKFPQCINFFELIIKQIRI